MYARAAKVPADAAPAGTWRRCWAPAIAQGNFSSARWPSCRAARAHGGTGNQLHLAAPEGGIAPSVAARGRASATELIFAHLRSLAVTHRPLLGPQLDVGGPVVLALPALAVRGERVAAHARDASPEPRLGDRRGLGARDRQLPAAVRRGGGRESEGGWWLPLEGCGGATGAQTLIKQNVLRGRPGLAVCVAERGGYLRQLDFVALAGAPSSRAADEDIQQVAHCGARAVPPSPSSETVSGDKFSLSRSSLRRPSSSSTLEWRRAGETPPNPACLLHSRRTEGLPREQASIRS